MDTIIFLPGGGGSSLALQGYEIWPPTLWEFATHYGRLPQLLDPRVVSTGIVDSIPPDQLLACPVYRPILDDLGGIGKSQNANVIPFPYDFRKSVFSSAKALKTQIEHCYNDGGRSITLVCHSTGNQVARAVLENVKWQGQPWFSSVNRYVGICGPHFGVPEVLEYGLGLSGWLSITAADMQTFSQDHRYPGCYQLFPFEGYDVLDDVNTGQEDFYDSTIANKFSLDQNNLVAALKLQKRLNFKNKPNGVEYVLIAASGHPTDQKIFYDGQIFVDITDNDAGDGTVPLWSTAPAPFNTFITPGDHIGVLSSYPFRDYLWVLLTGMHAPFFLAKIAGITVSLDRVVYSPGKSMSVLLIPDAPTEELDGTLKIDKVEDQEALKFKRYRNQLFTYRGVGLGVRFISAEATAPTEPGVYRITMSGKTHATAPQTAAAFAVSETGGRRARRRERR